MTVFWCQSALARTDFEMEVDADADGICYSDFFYGPYYFCSLHEGWKQDNCPDDANPDQTDSDKDDLGDVCDPTPTLDRDNDGTLDCQGGEPLDLCPPPGDFTCPEDGDDPNRPTYWTETPLIPCKTKDLSQTLDFDGDGIGNGCDPDADNDGFENEVDCDCLDDRFGATDEPASCPYYSRFNHDENPDPNQDPFDTNAGGCNLQAKPGAETKIRNWKTESLTLVSILLMALVLGMRLEMGRRSS